MDQHPALQHDSDGDLLAALPLPAYRTDAAGRLTACNAAAADLWGAAPEAGTAWPEAWRFLAPDGRPLAADERPAARALRAEQPLRDLALLAERPDGSRIRVEANPVPLRDSAGRITGVLDLLVRLPDGTGADIDRARLAAIVASSSDAIVSKTLDGIVTSWNDSARRIFGHSAEEMIGQPITRIIPAELHHEETAILAKLARGERVAHFDTVRLHKDGGRVDVSLTISPLIDEAGRIVGASKVARDVTERKRREALQRLLFNELNHRVKNMLATIQAIASQSLRRTPDPAAFAASFSGRIRALSVIHDLLVASELRGAEVRALLGALLPGAAGRTLIDGPPVLLAPKPAEQLGLALHELSTNAAAHGALSEAAHDGRLSVRWHTADGRLTLDWQETGAPRPAAAPAHGFGRRLIERALTSVGGSATVDDTPDGLTARLVLPLASAEADPDPAPPPAAAPEPSNGRGRILLVEDEPLVALDIESQLIGLGCTVIGPAATLEKAMALVEAGGFDAAFVDGNLGGRPVDSVVAALAAGGIPFTFVTGYDRDALPAAFRDAPLLAKPFCPERLAEALRSMVSG